MENNRRQYPIPREIQKGLILECLKLSYQTNVDELDCSKSYSRTETSKTVSEILDIGFKNKHTRYNFIYHAPICGDEEYYDVGLSTIGGSPSYFLWLRLTIKDGKDMIEKYQLKDYDCR